MQTQEDFLSKHTKADILKFKNHIDQKGIEEKLLVSAIYEKLNGIKRNHIVEYYYPEY